MYCLSSHLFHMYPKYCSDAEMYELLKAKRSADSHYRKIRLAYEGPKNVSRSRANETKKEAEAAEAKESEEGASGKKKSGKGSKENSDNTTGEQDEAAPKFKPTATKKQFVRSFGCD